MIKKTYTIKAPISEVWDALTDRFLIKEWSGYPAVMDDKPGTNFSLWEGDIHGTNIEVVPGQKLVQNWYGGDWEVPSLVTFMLQEADGVTTVSLEHTGIPPEETADFAAGWDDYYMLPIQKLLEPQSFPDTTPPGQINIEDVYDESILDALQQPDPQEEQQPPAADPATPSDQPPPPDQPTQ